LAADFAGLAWYEQESGEEEAGSGGSRSTAGSGLLLLEARSRSAGAVPSGQEV
jgi:hypothetical protein